MSGSSGSEARLDGLDVFDGLRMDGMRIGAHESIAGGLHLAFERAVADGAEAVQIFTKSGRQWAARELTEADVQAFRAAHAAAKVPVLVHDSYLINLGAEPGEVRQKSIAAFREELERCERLGLPWLVAHPGANEDEGRGLQLIADGIREAFAGTAGARVGVLLEGTAGQGFNLGWKFDHLRILLEKVGRPERTGVCLDTCHLFAAGYDLATAEGYEATMDELERTVGSARVKGFHLNDAKKGLACRVDRHEHIGDGTLGLAAFERVVGDPRFAGVPGVLETPEGRWKEEIALLKGLRDGLGARKRKVEKTAAKVAQETKRKAARLVSVAKTSQTPHSKRVVTRAQSGAGATSRR